MSNFLLVLKLFSFDENDHHAHIQDEKMKFATNLNDVWRHMKDFQKEHRTSFEYMNFHSFVLFEEENETFVELAEFFTKEAADRFFKDKGF